MPWQTAALDVGLEVDPATGLLAYSTVLVIVPRQAGKTFLVGVAGEHRCLSRRDARVWLTAQTGKDASDWMRDEHVPLMEGADALAGKWTKRMAAGSESVRWPDLGSIFRVFPPTRDALHGKQSDLVFVDEAWAHSLDVGEQVLTAIGPTQATRPGAQIWILSAQGDDASTFLHAWTERATAAVAADTGRGLAVVSYGVPEGLDAADPEVVARYHPAVGHTITPAFLVDELGRIGAPAFARSYGNRRTGAKAAVIDPGTWSNLTRPLALPADRRVALAFDVDPDSAAASLAAAWRDQTGQLRVQLRAHAPGVLWLPETVGEHYSRWQPTRLAYDPGGPAGASADRLARGGRVLMPLSTREYAAACAAFLDTVRDGGLAHDGAAPVDLAVAAADRRKIGDAWVWDRRTSAVALSPLIALTLAAWAVDHAPAIGAAPDIRAV